MIDQPSIWDEQLDLTEKQRDLLPAVKFWLLEDHRRSTPLGFGWSKNLSGPKSMSRMVFQKFPAPATADDVLCILNKIVVRAKALHLVELPQVSSRIKRPKPKSPFARDAGSCLRRVRSMQLVLTRWVDACPETVPPEAAILSAALYGGLLNTACLLTLVRTLHAVYRASDGYYVDLSLPWNGEPDMEKRRWFMDPCTAALLFRLDTESLQRLRCPEPGQCSVRDDILKGRLWKAIKREIQLHVPEADRPPSLAQMLLDMQMVARVELPSVVAAYAMRQKVVSHSLRASAYQRLEAHGHLSYRLAQDSAPVSEPVRSLASDNGREEKYAQPPWMRSLRLAMEGRNQKKILAALNVLKFAPNVQHNWGKYIVGFAIKLFEGESVARKRSLAKSTIRTHVRIVCRRFIGLLPIESIETVNLEELVAAYGQALDKCHRRWAETGREVESGALLARVSHLPSYGARDTGGLRKRSIRNGKRSSRSQRKHSLI